MKKTVGKNHNFNNIPEEKFAKKIVSQMVISLMVFALVFVNSKLPYSINQDINSTIKLYLVKSVDFNKFVNTAKIYINDFFNQIQTLPASGEINGSSVDES